MINESDFDEERAYETLARFLCSIGLPPHTVELHSFREFVEFINPGFNVETAKLERHCFEFYEEERARIKESLRSFDGHISLSMDISQDLKFSIFRPSDYIYDESILCVKAHFIDENWKLRNYVLGFRHTEDASPESIILEYISEWEIEGKIFSLMLESSRMHFDDHAIIVRNQLQDKRRLPIDGQLFQVSCCADMLCSMAVLAFNQTKRIISKIPHLVVSAPSPPWNLMLDCLHRALQLEANGELLKDEYKNLYVPSPEEWKKIRDVCRLVQLVYNVAEVIFETQHEGASTYLCNLQELLASLMEEANGLDQFVRTTAQKMVQKFSKYWKNMYLVLSIVTVMDPRYKMKYIEFSYPKYDAKSETSQASTVLQSLYTLYDGYAKQNSEEQKEEEEEEEEEEEYVLSDSNSESEEEFPQDVIKRRQNPKFGFNCLDEYTNFIKNCKHQPKSDLERYLEEPVLPWRKKFSVQSWWRKASPDYPILSKMASDLLAIRFSLVRGSEAYYTDMREPDHFILNPEIQNALVCTKSWCDESK